ncbi:hypothetical protein ONR57_21595 [Hoyosella sp. YIM 151337]|uniref:hypothetical protein n=1 Tax=Hoyosella sp. YIM 151337 TaxID=2992742 RepID=UPI0022363942|nr:hypothetical protein [Hoyosella sp. YIM 151337]MCW4355903.1 hypothetical protein [Hoyosella sp. YIM 151337]
MNSTTDGARNSHSYYPGRIAQVLLGLFAGVILWTLLIRILVQSGMVMPWYGLFTLPAISAGLIAFGVKRWLPPAATFGWSLLAGVAGTSIFVLIIVSGFSSIPH